MKTVEDKCAFSDGTCRERKCDGYGKIRISLSNGGQKTSHCKSPKNYVPINYQGGKK